jgi:DNA-directed RNA polymerase sigma subunit (sigma70/sigma32)
MTREEKLFAVMRRWVAVNKCLETFSDRERDIITAFFLRSSDLATMAKKHQITKERVRQIQERVLKMLCDMLFDPVDASLIQLVPN